MRSPALTASVHACVRAEWVPAFDEAEREEPALQEALRSMEAEINATARDL